MFLNYQGVKILNATFYLVSSTISSEYLRLADGSNTNNSLD